jgi:hypothetical protein
MVAARQIAEYAREGDCRSDDGRHTHPIRHPKSAASTRRSIQKRGHMSGDQVSANLKGMDDLDFTGWNGADWHGVFAHHHTDDVLGDRKGQPATHGIEEHIAAMKAYVESAGGTRRPRFDGLDDTERVRRQGAGQGSDLLPAVPVGPSIASGPDWIGCDTELAGGGHVGPTADPLRRAYLSLPPVGRRTEQLPVSASRDGLGRVLFSLDGCKGDHLLLGHGERVGGLRVGYRSLDELLLGLPGHVGPAVAVDDPGHRTIITATDGARQTSPASRGSRAPP